MLLGVLYRNLFIKIHITLNATECLQIYPVKKRKMFMIIPVIAAVTDS